MGDVGAAEQGRRESAGAAGVQCGRTTHIVRPSLLSSVIPGTRGSPDPHRRLYRQAMVWSETPSTIPYRHRSAAARAARSLDAGREMDAGHKLGRPQFV